MRRLTMIKTWIKKFKEAYHGKQEPTPNRRKKGTTKRVQAYLSLATYRKYLSTMQTDEETADRLRTLIEKNIREREEENGKPVM